MIKIQDILDFIGSKRPQYKMENWKNFKKAVKIPIKDENGNVGYYNDDNEKEGYWEVYYKNGKLKSKGKYINGKEDGYWESYYSDGKLWWKGNYKNGKKDGYWEYNNVNGKLESKGNYKNNFKDGYWDYFNQESYYRYNETY